MVTYKYTAISKDGVKISGVIEGFNELDAVDRIKQTCDIVIRLQEINEKKEGLLNRNIGGDRLNSKAFTVMCSQFSIILRAGIPISRTVRLIAEKTTDKLLKKILKQVADDVEAGRSLTESFRERGGKVLPTIFIETLHAGEESGNLDRAFETMYLHYDKQIKLRGKVKSALTYPAFILIIAVAVVVVLMVKVVPTFIQIFDSYGESLPVITQSLIVISEFFQNYWIILVLILGIFFLIYKVYSNLESGRLQLAKISLKLPVLGNISELSAASEFANNMTTLIGSGLQITRAISITARVIENYYISQEIGKMASKLEEGRSLGSCMRESGCLPDILVDMVAVGEETGELEETLHTIAGYYDAELEMAIQDAIKKLEPAVLIFVAAIAGYIVLAIYIAMFTMYGIM